MTAIRHISYNEEQNVVAVASEDGVRIFHLSPLKEMLFLPAEVVGSIRIAAVLHRSNIVAVVAGPPRPKYASNTIMIWDDKAKEFVMEVTVPGGPILDVQLNFTRLVAIQSHRVHVFSLLPSVRFLRTEETGPNGLGVAAMGGEATDAVLAVPFFKTGVVQLISVENVTENKSLSPTTIEAHQAAIRMLAVSKKGTLLATGSANGTVIRVFYTRTRQQISELRRGSDPCNLYCLRFAPCSSLLSVTSDKGTVHVFAVRENQEVDGWTNRKNIFDDTKRSIAQFTLPAAHAEGTIRCAFIEDPSGAKSECRDVAAVCADGSFHRFSFTKDGHVDRVGFDWLLRLGSEQAFWFTPF